MTGEAEPDGTWPQAWGLRVDQTLDQVRKDRPVQPRDSASLYVRVRSARGQPASVPTPRRDSTMSSVLGAVPFTP